MRPSGPASQWTPGNGDHPPVSALKTDSPKWDRDQVLVGPLKTYPAIGNVNHLAVPASEFDGITHFQLGAGRDGNVFGRRAVEKAGLDFVAEFGDRGVGRARQQRLGAQVVVHLNRRRCGRRLIRSSRSAPTSRRACPSAFCDWRCMAANTIFRQCHRPPTIRFCATTNGSAPQPMLKMLMRYVGRCQSRTLRRPARSWSGCLPRRPRRP